MCRVFFGQKVANFIVLVCNVCCLMNDQVYWRDGVTVLLWCSGSRIGYCRRVCSLFADTDLTFHVAGLIVLHCVLYDYSTVMVFLTCVFGKILHYLRYTFLILLLTRLSGVHFTNYRQSKLPNQSTSGDREREVIFRTQSLPSSWTELIFC